MPACSGSDDPRLGRRSPSRTSAISGEKIRRAARSGSTTGAAGARPRRAGSGAVDGQQAVPALRARRPRLGVGHGTRRRASPSADADRRAVRARGRRARVGDDADQVVDGVGRGEVERDTGEGGQPARGAPAPPPGRRSAPGRARTDRTPPRAPGGAIPPRGSASSPPSRWSQHVVGDVLGPLDDVAAGARRRRGPGC